MSLATFLFKGVGWEDVYVYIEWENEKDIRIYYTTQVIYYNYTSCKYNSDTFWMIG